MEPRISLITLGVDDLERSYRFYHDALAFPASYIQGNEIVFFRGSGARLALYPRSRLNDDIAPRLVGRHSRFPGITLTHDTADRQQVDRILASAQACGGAIVKPASDTFWGGYSGYFTDPDGYLWEVAWADVWQSGALAMQG
ncbi:MAG: VOC family protein [Oceanospirillales bacterium]|nr:VOC family protein [Oceanospirillales bacterium]